MRRGSGSGLRDNGSVQCGSILHVDSAIKTPERLVVPSRDAGSFDCVRLPPHSAPDDNRLRSKWSVKLMRPGRSRVPDKSSYFFCTTAIPEGPFPPEANGEPARAVSTPVCELKVNTEMSSDALHT